MSRRTSPALYRRFCSLGRSRSSVRGPSRTAASVPPDREAPLLVVKLTTRASLVSRTTLAVGGVAEGGGPGERSCWQTGFASFPPDGPRGCSAAGTAAEGCADRPLQGVGMKRFVQHFKGAYDRIVPDGGLQVLTADE